MEPKKPTDYANLTESEIRGELETKFGELYDKWYAAGSCRSYPLPSGREDFVKNCMTIVDTEIEQVKKSESLPAVADSREITKYAKLASKG